MLNKRDMKEALLNAGFSKDQIKFYDADMGHLDGTHWLNINFKTYDEVIEDATRYFDEMTTVTKP